MRLILNGRQGKTILVEGSVIKIRKRGWLLASEREKTLPIRSVTSVEVKKPGPFAVGFIQFSIAGGATRDSSFKITGGAIDAVQDENSVVFADKASYQVALKIKAYLENYTEASSSAASSSTSVADEIAKFKNLMDQGIISPGEYEAKKRQLLGLGYGEIIQVPKAESSPAPSSEPVTVVEEPVDVRVVEEPGCAESSQGPQRQGGVCADLRARLRSGTVVTIKEVKKLPGRTDQLLRIIAGEGNDIILWFLRIVGSGLAVGSAVGILAGIVFVVSSRFSPIEGTVSPAEAAVKHYHDGEFARSLRILNQLPPELQATSEARHLRNDCHLSLARQAFTKGQYSVALDLLKLIEDAFPKYSEAEALSKRVLAAQRERNEKTDSGGGGSSTPGASSSSSQWFQGGTLHNAAVEQWKAATYENKLATAADWLGATKWKGHLNSPDDFDRLKLKAQTLVKAVDVTVATADETAIADDKAAVIEQMDSEQVNAIAATLITMSNDLGP